MRHCAKGLIRGKVAPRDISNGIAEGKIVKMQVVGNSLQESGGWSSHSQNQLVAPSPRHPQELNHSNCDQKHYTNKENVEFAMRQRLQQFRFKCLAFWSKTQIVTAVNPAPTNNGRHRGVASTRNPLWQRLKETHYPGNFTSVFLQRQWRFILEWNHCTFALNNVMAFRASMHKIHVYYIVFPWVEFNKLCREVLLTDSLKTMNVAV